MSGATATIMPDTKDGVTNEPSVKSATGSVDAGVMDKEALQIKTDDIAEDLYREIEHFTPEELEAEQIKVRQLIDWRIMPIVSQRISIALDAC